MFLEPRTMFINFSLNLKLHRLCFGHPNVLVVGLLQNYQYNFKYLIGSVDTKRPCFRYDNTYLIYVKESVDTKSLCCRYNSVYLKWLLYYHYLLFVWFMFFFPNCWKSRWVLTFNFIATVLLTQNGGGYCIRICFSYHESCPFS